MHAHSLNSLTVLGQKRLALDVRSSDRLRIVHTRLDTPDGTGPPASAGDIDVNGEEFHNCMAKVNLALSTVDGEQTVSIESIFDTRSGLISSLDVGTGEDMSDITRSIDFNELTVTATVSNLSGDVLDQRAVSLGMGKPGLAYGPDAFMAAEAQPSAQSGNPQVDTAETANAEAGMDPCAAATHDDRENVPNCNLTNVRTVEQAQDPGRGCTNLKADTHHLHEAGRGPGACGGDGDGDGTDNALRRDLAAAKQTARRTSQSERRQLRLENVTSGAHVKLSVRADARMPLGLLEDIVKQRFGFKELNDFHLLVCGLHVNALPLRDGGLDLDFLSDEVIYVFKNQTGF